MLNNAQKRLSNTQINHIMQSPFDGVIVQLGQRCQPGEHVAQIAGERGFESHWPHIYLHYLGHRISVDFQNFTTN